MGRGYIIQATGYIWIYRQWAKSIRRRKGNVGGAEYRNVRAKNYQVRWYSK